MSEEQDAENSYERLRQAVIRVIAIDRLVGGDVDEKDAVKVELLPGDSVMVADLLRGLGLPIGDYP